MVGNPEVDAFDALSPKPGECVLESAVRENLSTLLSGVFGVTQRMKALVRQGPDRIEHD